MLHRIVSFLLILVLILYFSSLGVSQFKLPQAEVVALYQIATTMGANNWSFDHNTCQLSSVGLMPDPDLDESTVTCSCNVGYDRYCHVVKIVLKHTNLPGILSPEMAKLPYLQEVDFAYNYLSGTIPPEWSSMQLNRISLLANRLSGEIPKHLSRMPTLTYLMLEANQFSGSVPPELGKMVNLKTLCLSSNQLSGELPSSLAYLENLEDLINDNNFSGRIPNFIQNWKNLNRLELIASGLEGPIPSNISVLTKLTDLRIAYITGAAQEFPDLRNVTGLINLILRSCNLLGGIPYYIWKLDSLNLLDVSFNQLTGEIPSAVRGKSLKFMFLTGNMISGSISESLLKGGSSIDLSYNNFKWQNTQQPACRANGNYYINLFRSSSENSLRSILPCNEDFTCPSYGCSMHINCGGSDLIVKETTKDVLYQGDGDVSGGAAKYYINTTSKWGFSSTGDFLDDNDFQNTRFTKDSQSPSISDLYKTARISPLTLTYFSYCLENGDYNVRLYFAEIFFTNDNSSQKLGRRLFDIYIQDKLVIKNFNIEDEAGGAQKELIRNFNATVEDNILQIRFYWAGKGTTRIPDRGIYGPLISAISVNHHFKICSEDSGQKKGRKKNVTAFIVTGCVAFLVILLAGFIIYWKRHKTEKKINKDLEGLELQIRSFTLKEIKSATNNFDCKNKIGEGGFGPVYKGYLSDGTLIAVKQLSSKSKQGNREFLNEIGMISRLQHPNLVHLHGCCIEGDQLLLVYEFMENNSVAHVLFGDRNEPILGWSTRFKICVGIAKGLAFMHEESTLKIVHRDIKATNVLLSKELDPKISDFGLARLNEDDRTHVSTRVAGTIGYMAPEYALWGHLSYKADVYSFGVLLLEIVSGKNNNNFMPDDGNFVCLLDWACHLEQKGTLTKLVDERVGWNFDKEEVERVVKIAILCTNGSPSLRPMMSEIVGMLEGHSPIPDVTPGSSSFSEDLRFKSMRDLQQEKQSKQSTDNACSSSSNNFSSCSR
ncbi:probable LRR receptor-like serine/threonine-protein kinase RFK1 isoform X2 [Impatiens glandulifera]|uniref:probable LRR receptor-like serine/threonine-protein kinase RFK1 isoform X2 n=1 Tax=Impatiens glandulifera TaxID=253017 RepID=UPI001FB0AD9D|nr:probable LRR receptor-like serine/threonine-protein kinase RFK1 isoform X2 [Impatiens glandulifera]